MSGIDIGPARPDEAAALAAILTRWVARTPWMPKLHTAEEDREFLRTLLASADVTAARRGSAAIGFLARRDDEILAFQVADPRRGVGSLLVDRAKADVSRLGAWTFQANEAARRFYARHGFAEIRRTEGENEEGLPDIYLEWPRS